MADVKNYRDVLLEELGRKEYENVTKSFDIVGNIAVINAKGGLAKKVGNAVMATHNRVETVLRKGGAVSGRYRTRKLHFVCGKRNYVARYRENGVELVFDIRKVFFSPRLAFERKRIVDLSTDGENVIVMFAGVGPFAIEIARKNRRSKVIAIELNRDAYKYLLGNIKGNNAANVEPVLGDAAKVSKKYRNFADRIVMPLPMKAKEFLDVAFLMAKRKAVIHYYTFIEGTQASEKRFLKKFAAKHHAKLKIMGERTVRPYSSRISEEVFDLEIKKSA